VTGKRNGAKPSKANRSNKALRFSAATSKFRRLTAGKINRITVLLLLIGFGSALVIYLTARPVTLDPLLGDPLTNKKFVHELRVIGGKSNVMAAQFIDWFAGLWQGENLAGTVAVLTVAVTLAFRFVAARPDLYASAPAHNKRPPGNPR
jgi:hypothetical protein